MTQQPRTPTTEAGRDPAGWTAWDDLYAEFPTRRDVKIRALISKHQAAIEAEARADALDEDLLATALEGYEIVPYKPSTNDDYEAHRQGAAKAIAAAYRIAAYQASQERV